jgi:putative membrane protein
MARAIVATAGAGIAAVLLGWAQPSWAANGAPQGSGDPRGGGDQQIVMELHHANLNEIQMGRMAQARATSARVKDYGATLVKDHQAADAKLLGYARRKGMNMDEISKPYDALPHGALEMAEVASSKGVEFNHNFAQKMVADHQKNIDAATTAQKIARDPELKALIQAMLPTLDRHQAAAEALVASEPQPPSHAVQPPGEPSGVSRTHTGVDGRAGVIP